MVHMTHMREEKEEGERGGGVTEKEREEGEWYLIDFSIVGTSE